MNDLPVTALDALALVGDHGSFTSAAAAMGVSVSAVSQSIRTLEARVGVALVVRTTRSVRLTDAGRTLADRAREGFRDVRAALDDAARDPAGLRGTLRLTVPHMALPLGVTAAVRALRAKHPTLAVEVNVDDRNVDIVREGYDAGLRLVESVERDMVAVRLTAPFAFVAVAAPAYLDARGAPKHPRDLAQHACINYRSLTTGRLYRWELESGARSLRVGVEGPITTNDVAFAVACALAGEGITYVAEPLVRAHLERGALRVVMPRWTAPVPGLFWYLPRASRTEPRVKALLAVTRALVKGA